MAVPLLLLAACWLAVAAAALAAAIVAHEAAHALLAWSFGLTARMHAGPAAILRVLDPRPPSRATWSRLPHVRVSAAAGGSQPAAAALRWARHAGWWASAALCASTVAAHSAWAATAPPPLQAALHAAVCMTGVVLACSLPTDLCGASAGCGATCFCGNLGLLLASATGAAAAGVDALDVLERQVAISTMRGAQSGGLVTLVNKDGNMKFRVEGARCRVAPTKRQSLAALLGRQFRRAAGGASHPGDHGLFLGHTRFATSSTPLPSESHPHRWSAAADCRMWRADGRGGVTASTESFSLYVTHNGDYDFARDAAGRYRTHHELSAWLAAVLGCPPTAKCDSVCLAGMLELHRCQGSWTAALRLALVEVSGVPFERIVAAGEAQHSATPAAAASQGQRGDEEAGARPGADVASAAELAALGAAANAAFAAFLASMRGSSIAGSDGSKAWSEEEAAAAAAGKAADAEGSEAGPRTPVAPGSEAQRLLEAVGGAAGAAQLAAALAAALRAALLPAGKHLLPAWLGCSSLEAVAAAAVHAFIHADLFAAMARVMRAAKGSFGVAAACTLDADRVCLAAWGQPMSIALCPDLQAALFSSETQNVMLSLLPGGAGGAEGSSPNGWRPGHCTHRIDMDEGGGEVMQLVLRSPSAGSSTPAGGDADGWALTPEHPDAGFLRLRVFSLRRGREVGGPAEFAGAGRLVDLKNSPYVSYPSIGLTPGHDVVAADLADIPRLLHAIAADWCSPLSLNRRTAAAFAAALQRIAAARRRGGHASEAGGGDTAGQELDVLLTGVEVSLWVAEQFAADLKTLLPGLRVEAVSANKVIAVLGNNRGRLPATGFPFCRSSARLDSAIVLAVSHSGQASGTFPTIHAVRLLEAQNPGRVFVMSGSVDTKMALVLGQRLAPGAPFCERCFDTKAGWRSAEPATASVVALAQSLTELLLYVGAVLCCGSSAGGGSAGPTGVAASPGEAARADASPQLTATASSPPFGLPLSPRDLLDLRVVRDDFIRRAAPALVGADASGAPVAAPAHEQLVAQGRRWALHVLEGPWAWALAAAYIAATVISGYPLVHAVTEAICSAAGASAGLATGLGYLALVLDSGIYIFSSVIAACLLRLAQRRPLLARWGKRTVVVADVPAVAQIAEAFLSKCFALSYGIASVEVHSGNPQDHFVHRFTHRVARGLLLAVGRPDGRLYSQTQSESWVLLGLLQAKVIASLGAQPEVVSLGHNPYSSEYIDCHLVLPTCRPTVLAELLQGLDSSAGANPNALFAARRHTLAGTVLSKTALEAAQRHRAQSLSERYSGAEVQPADVAAAQGQLRMPTAADLTDTPPHGFGAACSVRGSVGVLASCRSGVLAFGQEGHVLGEHRLSEGSLRDEVEGVFQRVAAVSKHKAALLQGGSAGAASAALGALASSMVQTLEDQGVVEALMESRFLSLERLIAFFVLFHAMASRVAHAWPLCFDASRSQSGLRIATTAAPVTASDIERTIAEVQAEQLLHGAGAGHCVAIARRWRSAATRALLLRQLGKL